MTEIIKFIWLIVPAGIANMIPPLSMLVWPKWNAPVDGGKKWKGLPILGSHKTWRGLITGIIGAQIGYWVLTLIMVGNSDWPWWFGGLLGAGALGGDMVKSFFKRRVGVVSGKAWFPWDQIDWIIGIILVSSWWKVLSLLEMLILTATGLGLHLLVKIIGYRLKVNETAI